MTGTQVQFQQMVLTAMDFRKNTQFESAWITGGQLSAQRLPNLTAMLTYCKSMPGSGEEKPSLMAESVKSCKPFAFRQPRTERKALKLQ